MPIFRVKSEKIYTSQKKITRAPPVAPVTNMRYDWVSDKLFDGNLLKTAPVINVTCASLRGANISFPCDIKAENFV